MSLIAVKEQFKSQVETLGKAALNAIYPNDFPFYFLALSLQNSDGIVVDYFSWPILPDELRETHNEITSIRKTLGGVNVQKNITFTPRQISIRGDFGRNFKIIVNGQPITFAGFGLSIQNGKFDIKPPNILENTIPQFSSFAKTGYGCVKILEGIKEKSKKLDEHGKPFSLYLYNPILGNNYQVEINNFTHHQDSERYNMIPAYQLQMTAVAPLENLMSKKALLNSAIKNFSFSYLQKTANNIASNIRQNVKFK